MNMLDQLERFGEEPAPVPWTLRSHLDAAVATLEKESGLDRLAVIKQALDLVVELWPKPGYASVTLETHQWIKLRRVLLSIPDLVAHDE